MKKLFAVQIRKQL